MPKASLYDESNFINKGCIEPMRRLFITQKNTFLARTFFLVACFVGAVSCTTPPLPARVPALVPVNLPYLRLAHAGECYFIDDFMPTPDTLVTGRSTGLSLRYYTYWNARYKSWAEVGIMLSFYSKDSRCWSLFEEYVLARPDEDSNSDS